MVENLQGKRELIALGKETSGYGTAVTPTIRLGKNAEWIPNNENDWQEVKGAGTDSITNSFDIGNKIVRGTLRFVPQNWKILTFVIGTTTNTGSDPYTHTFSSNTDFDLLSFTLERGLQATTDSVRTYEGCQINNFTLRWNVQVGGGGRRNYVQAEADIIAEDVNEGSSTTSLTAPTTAGFLSYNVTTTLNTSAKAQCVSGFITVNNNLHDARYAYYDSNTGYLKNESRVQERTFNGEFVLHYSDKTEFDFWDNRVVVPGTNTVVFNRGTNDTLTCTFTNLRIISSNDPTNLDGLNQVTLRWVADSVAFVAVDSLDDYITA